MAVAFVWSRGGHNGTRPEGFSWNVELRDADDHRSDRIPIPLIREKPNKRKVENCSIFLYVAIGLWIGYIYMFVGGLCYFIVFTDLNCNGRDSPTLQFLSGHGNCV